MFFWVLKSIHLGGNHGRSNLADVILAGTCLSMMSSKLVLKSSQCVSVRLSIAVNELTQGNAKLIGMAERKMEAYVEGNELIKNKD